MKPDAHRPVITLTTDFGLADHFVGTMKGVILSRCPEAQLVDISHEITAFSLYSGAYTIDQAAPYYPAGTIHVVVVDPGVGTSRRALLVEALGQSFIAPDNGVLSLIQGRDPGVKSREITNRSLWLDTPSATFHGRDVFAPVAAAIASEAARASDVGPLTARIELLTGLETRQIEPGRWEGRILSVDRFGNVITNFKADKFDAIRAREFGLHFGGGLVRRWAETFGCVKPGECFAYFGSSGYIEAGINQGNAALALKATPGELITLKA